MAIKISKGALKIKVPHYEFRTAGIENVGLDVLHVQVHHSSRLTDMPYHQKDPFTLAPTTRKEARLGSFSRFYSRIAHAGVAKIEPR